MSKNVHVPVIRLNFEPALRGRKPAIDNATHGKPALAEPESERLLITAIAGVSLHTNRHAVTAPWPEACPARARLKALCRADALRACKAAASDQIALDAADARSAQPGVRAWYAGRAFAISSSCLALAMWPKVPSANCARQIGLDDRSGD